MRVADHYRDIATFFAFARMLFELGFRRSGHRFSKRGFAGDINVTRSSRGSFFVAFINGNADFRNGPFDFAHLLLTLTGRADYGWAWARLEMLLEEESAMDLSMTKTLIGGVRAPLAVQKLAGRMSSRAFPLHKAALQTVLEKVQLRKNTQERALARALHVARAKLNTQKVWQRAKNRRPRQREQLDKLLARERELTRLANAGSDQIEVTWCAASTITGRWSASPSVMSLSKDLREICKAPTGEVVVVGDLGAADVVAAGILSGERQLARAASQDIYMKVAARLFGSKQAASHRRLAKVLTLKSLYNAGPDQLRDSLSEVMPHISRGQASELCEQWEQAHPRYISWRERLFRLARQTGRLAISSQRVIRFEPAALTHEGQTAAWCVQGTIAALFDQMLLTLESRLRKFGGIARLVGMVHDSAIVVCRSEDAKRVAGVVRASLCSASIHGRQFRFRVDVKVGPSWGDLREVTL